MLIAVDLNKWTNEKINFIPVHFVYHKMLIVFTRRERSIFFSSTKKKMQKFGVLTRLLNSILKKNHSISLFFIYKLSWEPIFNIYFFHFRSFYSFVFHFIYTIIAAECVSDRNAEILSSYFFHSEGLIEFGMKVVFLVSATEISSKYLASVCKYQCEKKKRYGYNFVRYF